MTSEDMSDEEIEAHLETLDLTCRLCGKDSRGEASINDDFYCHRDEGISCYMQASWADAGPYPDPDGWKIVFVDERDKA